MTALDSLLQLIPQVVRPVVPADKAANVLLIPPAPVGQAKQAKLTHTGPARVSDALPLRVVAVLGPGATFRGLATVLLPRFNAATGLPAGTKPLTQEELAKGLADFADEALGPGDGHHQVGLLVPLPIEVDGSGKWTVDVPGLRARARAFRGTPILGRAPKPLPVPDPAQIEGEASSSFVPPFTPGMPRTQWERALRNPSELVLVFYEVVRLRARTGAKAAASFTLDFLATAQPHHLQLLAATTAGNALLRRLRTVLAGAVPAGVDAADFAAKKALVDNALFQGPAGNRTLVPHLDVPLSIDLLDDPGGVALPTPGAPSDPAGGFHRLVLGRDVAAGRDPTAPKGSTTFAGPVGFGGRLELDPYLEEDEAGLGSGDPLVGGPLELLSQESPGKQGRRLDTVVANHSLLLTVGIEHWSATDARGLPALLFAVKASAPDEFDLHIGLHGLDVDRDPADTTKFRLRQVGASGTASTPLNAAQVAAFFGRGGSGAATTFDPLWPARLRFAALVARGFRRAQLQLAGARVKTTAKPIELAVASAGPFPKPYVLDLETGPPSPAMGVRLQDRVATPRTEGTPPDVGLVASSLPAGTEARKTVAGFVIDLTGNPAKFPFAGFQADETFYVGSMGKAAALYAALELRTRLRIAVDRAGQAGFDFRPTNWHTRFVPIVTRLWSSRVGRGFPKLDAAMPRRFPRLDQIFRFDTVAAVPARPTMAGKVDFTPTFDAWILDMIQRSDTHAAASIIDRLDFPYLNGALRQAGFYDPRTNLGIWVSGNYLGGKGDWVVKEDLAVLTPRGAKHYKPTTNFMGNARQFARLFALAATGKLFGDAAASAAMVEYMRKEGRTGDRTPCFVKDAIEATDPGVGGRPTGSVPLAVEKYADKIGIGDPAPPSPLQGICDGAIIERPHPPVGDVRAHLRYVLVFVGGYKRPVPDVEREVHYRLVQELDGVVAAAHPPAHP
jgi:hypothetical protein